MKNIRKLSLALLCLLPLSGMAIQNGAALSYGTGFGSASDPNGINGFNIAYTMQPDSWQWLNGDLNVFLNFSYGYWHTNDYSSNQSISTFAAAPVIRWYFLNNPTATPFLQGSVGPTYLSKTYFGDRNLGIHFAFEDMAGFGFAFGAQKKVYATLQIVHYSNAGMSDPNSGFTVPFLFTVGMNF
jgi:hypothetical protein